MQTRAATALLVTLLAAGCTKPIASPHLGELYNRAAMRHGPDRNPVIVIPGILGSRLVDPNSDTLVWGAFGSGSANPNSTDGARLIALPMKLGVPLSELRDGVVPDGALDRVRVSVLGLPLELEAYASILATLGVGGYMDQSLGGKNAVDYGTDHYTCFQFDYDWRRDNVESAAKLLAFINEKRAFVQRHLAEDYGGEPGDYEVKFDIVAHSMGGLLTRYMLRYGDAEPEQALAEGVTWKGAEHVERVVLVGTPNAGSVKALINLIQGLKPSPFHARYDAALLGTMPSIYQLLPRDRHERVMLGKISPPISSTAPTYPKPRVLDTDTWRRYRWGLLDPRNAKAVERVLPGVGKEADRLNVVVEHVRKCLERAKHFQDALDVPAKLPPHLTLTLFAGDAVETDDTVEINGKGRIGNVTSAPGDGTVTRASALLDERDGASRGASPDASGGTSGGDSGRGGGWQPHLVTPIDWTDVNFLYTDHLGLTADPTFSDNVLHLLLESPHVAP